ncbi:MAG: ThiF family adenylyltransferase [Pirellulales bacterium]|nr:ThiF family adenylyltransferase [Pirellulales bacterium]
MPSTNLPRNANRSRGRDWAEDVAFDRVRRVHTFRRDRFARWCGAEIGVVGAGLLGSRVAIEIVRSGGRVWLCDFDYGSRENLGNQCVAAGPAKVDSVVAACDAIWPGRAEGAVADIRHVGIGVLKRLAAMLDCTDNPDLALPLTQISNGLGRPLLRCAVDGSGEHELGRVLCSDGRRGRACQICPYGLDDLLGRHRRTPCPGASQAGPAPTLAGGPIGMVIAGAAVLQAQRLVTGNDRHLVFNREILVDLDGLQILAIEHRRSDDCLSGHVRWRLDRLGLAEATLADIFSAARQRLGRHELAIEPFGHPLSLHASCSCGEGRAAVGSLYTEPPTCGRCGRRMTWREEASLDRLSEDTAAELGVLHVPTGELGLPAHGAMFIARVPDRPPVYLVLD